MSTFSPISELWLTLARAFLPPLTRQAQEAFSDILPNDLYDLCAWAGVNADSAIDAFEAAAAGYGCAGELLVHYSSLFIAPPVAARLNVAACLEGTINGPVMDGIEALMGKYGIGRSESFHDTPDHLSSLLEFMALLESGTGTEEDRNMLAGSFLAPALRRMRADVARVAPGSPYAHLLDIVALALAPKLAGQTVAENARRSAYNRDPTKGVWRACAKCGRLYAREKELRVMARALQEQGLATEHLALCPGCRSPVQAMTQRR